MHSAPSVSYPVGRSSRHAHCLLLALWSAGGCVAALTAWRLEHLGGRTALLGASVLLASFGLRHGGTGRAQGPAVLHFDGSAWALVGAASTHARGLQTARAEVCLDFQSLMLVRLQQAGREQRWLWLDARSEPARWADLRRAVYSRAPTTVPDSDPMVPLVARASASSTFS